MNSQEIFLRILLPAAGLLFVALALWTIYPRTLPANKQSLADKAIPSSLGNAQDAVTNPASSSPSLLKNSANQADLLTSPISAYLLRVTKKPFGIKISPSHSPVSPEKFSGYHTGVDFEILPEEENKDVPVNAVCPGKLLLKKWASGYGGVAVESCQIGNEAATIVYGHLKLSSVKIKTGDSVKAGEPIGILGKGYSTETDGERKHLHLSIHKGAGVILLGYVQNKKDLDSWLDAMQYLPKK